MMTDKEMRTLGTSPPLAALVRLIIQAEMTDDFAESEHSTLRSAVQQARRALQTAGCQTCQGTGEVPDRSGNFPERPGAIAGPFIDMMECPDCALR